MPKFKILEQTSTWYEVEGDTAEAAYDKLRTWDRNRDTCEHVGIFVDDESSDFTVVQDEDGNEVEV